MAPAFVYHFIRIYAPFVVTVFLSSVEAQTLQLLVGQNLVKKRIYQVTAKSTKADFFSTKKMDLIKELDEIMREMVWLIRSQRPSANQTLFGKIFRALQQAKGLKLTEKSKHSCDQYLVEKVSEYQYRVYEHCQKHRAPDLLAKIDWSHRKIDFQFQGQNYADVLGLAASLVAPTISCQVSIDDAIKLLELYCSGFRITRADNVVRFESIVYKKNKDPQMVLKGEVLKNLLPFSDLKILVPLLGKVKILEKKKMPDIDEITPPITPQSGPVVPVDPRVIPSVEPLANEPHPNIELRKQSDPDVIEIKEPNYTR